MADQKNSGLGFVSSVAVLSFGAVLVQTVTIATAPVISRLFEPAVFGVAGAFAGVVMLVGSSSSLFYSRAILLPKEDEAAANLMLLSLLLTLLVTGGTALLSLTAGPRILTAAGAAEVVPVVGLLPLGVVAWGLGPPMNSWLMRRRRFVMLAATGVMSVLVYAGLAIAGGSCGFVSAHAMIAFRIVGMAVVPVLLTANVLWFDRALIRSAARLQEMWQLLDRYRRFPMFILPTELLKGVIIQLPVLLMIAYYGKEAGGLYSYAAMLLSLPAALLGQTVGTAFMPHAAYARAHDQDLAPMVSGVLSRMLRLGALPFGMLMVVAPELFSMYLGVKWTEAGHYAVIIAPFLFCQFVSGPPGMLYQVLEKQAQRLVTATLMIIVLVASFQVGHRHFSARGTLVLLSALGSALLLGQSFWICRQAGVSIRDLVGMTVAAIAQVLPFIGLVAVVKYGFHANLAVLLAVLGGSSCAYALWLLKSDPVLLQEVLKLVPARFRKPRSK